MTRKLRFAPIVRVSTEQQAEKGESLQTQQKQIISYVQTLGGVIPEACWKYSGQEHATPDQERTKLDQLLTDSAKGLFDAVIVCNASRWSRDNFKSKIGLSTLKRNGIRFFVSTMEYDLADPTAELILGVFTEFNQFAAREQSRKSILSRIGRARKGIPTGGKLPYGRVFDKNTKRWGLDEEKASKIRWAAQEYLNGRKMSEIAKFLGMNHPNLWKVITKRSGDKWEIKFNKPDLKIDEVVEITIPCLLTDEIIEAIKEKAKANKTYHHGHIKHKYLLSRMVFCGHCGYAMFGQTNHSTRRYYRHARGRKNACQYPGFWVRAGEVETAVFVHLFNASGNTPKLERAIQAATPDKERLDSLVETHKRLSKLGQKLKRKKKRLIDAVSDGLISGQEIKEKMDEIVNNENAISEELDLINAQLGDQPTKGQIERRARLWQAVLKNASRGYSNILSMSYQDKRQLIESALGGMNPEGVRYGVYVYKADDDAVRYEIKGNLPPFQFKGDLPVSDLELIDRLGIDTEYQKKSAFKDELDLVKLNIVSKRDAHNGVGIHQQR